MLVPGTEAHRRFALQRREVEQLNLFVWPQVHSGWQIYRAARANRYDVITVQDPFWRGLLALKIAWLTSTKLNVQVHTDLSAQPFFRHVLAQIVLRHADSMRVVSEKIRAQVGFMRTRASIHVLPVYVGISRFQNLARQSHAPKTILWIGRLEHEKDPLAAIRVLQEVRKKGVDAKLIMLGTGSLMPEIHQASQGLPIELPGWQDPRPYLERADVVLSTSKYESWGASIVEALAAGVPVVAPDVGIAKEAGAIVVPRSEFASAVVDILQTGKRGVLRLSLPTAEEWAKHWKETLV